jgi:hypothetical protein
MNRDQSEHTNRFAKPERLRKPPRARRPSLEQLEARQLLSWTPITGTFSGNCTVFYDYSNYNQTTCAISVTISSVTSIHYYGSEEQAQVSGSATVSGFLGRTETFAFPYPADIADGNIETAPADQTSIGVQIDIASAVNGPNDYFTIDGELTSEALKGDIDCNFAISGTAGSEVGAVTLTAAPHVTPKATLSEVTFGGSGFHPMSSDPSPSGTVTTYTTAQWTSPPNHEDPVLYAADGNPELSAKFQLGSPQPAPTAEARGFGTDGFDVPAMKLTPSGDTLSLSNVKMSKAFDQDQGAQYFADFTIQWQVSFNGGATWTSAGESVNPLYVSASTNPQPDPSGYFYRTVVDSEVNATLGLSASKSNNIKTIITNTWQLFAFRSVREFSANSPFSDGSEHGTALTYYGKPKTTGSLIGDTTQQIVNPMASGYSPNTKVGQLLATGDGECMTFAKLFLDMLLVSGVSYENDLVTVGWASPSAYGFLVNNWKFVGTGEGGNYFDVPAQTVHGTSGAVYHVPLSYQVLKQQGAPGQNSANPLANFNNHVIVYIYGTFYDPSYGLSYRSLAEMAARDIAGLYVWVSVNPAVLGLHYPGVSSIRAMKVLKPPMGYSLPVLKMQTWG